jgi:hypothetical protein
MPFLSYRFSLFFSTVEWIDGWCSKMERFYGRLTDVQHHNVEHICGLWLGVALLR